MMKGMKLRSCVRRLGYFYIFDHRYFGTSKFYFFFLKYEGKIKILRGYCRDKGPNLYSGPWALFDDIDASEEEYMIEEALERRITYRKGGVVLSNEVILLR